MSITNQRVEIKTSVQEKNGRFKCPYCGRWNDIDDGRDWVFEYDKDTRMYRIFTFTYCVRCEMEMYIGYTFKDHTMEV